MTTPSLTILSSPTTRTHPLPTAQPTNADHNLPIDIQRGTNEANRHNEDNDEKLKQIWRSEQEILGARILEYGISSIHTSAIIDSDDEDEDLPDDWYEQTQMTFEQWKVKYHQRRRDRERMK